MIACEECGLVVALPEISDGQKAHCPRCQHTLISQISMPFTRPFAYAIACLIMLLLSISFPFMSFTVQGATQTTTLLNAIEMLTYFKNTLLSLLLLLTVVILPAAYITAVLYLYRQAALYRHVDGSGKQIRLCKRLLRVIVRIEPWLMVDVFLIGVLVSLIKIASLADIGLGASFWAFCGYTMLVVKCVSISDRTWLWQQFIPLQKVDGIKVGDSHISANHVNCHCCSQINPIPNTADAKCSRCENTLHHYNPDQSLQHAWAFLITAMVFYIPANLYPIMYTVSLGNSEGSTIMGGVVLLWKLKSYPIAVIIFIASIAIPLAKIFSLIWLFMNAGQSSQRTAQQSIQQLRLYRLTELIGRWSMIDIFVVTILVALVQLQNLMAISPGPGALSFAVVVIFTMLSAMTFDPRVFWSSSANQQQQDNIFEQGSKSPVQSNFNENSDHE